MVGKIIMSFLFSAVLIVGFVYGYSFLQTTSFASLSNNYVEFQSLLNRPDFYANKFVCTVGIYHEDAENSFLRNVTNNVSGTIWINAPVEKTILGKIQVWINKYKKLWDPLESTVKVCGTFQYTTNTLHGFGPSESYEFQITK
jgi:hypothetical protein